MSVILLIGGSPSESSRSSAVLGDIATQLQFAGHAVNTLEVRDLPAIALLHADFADAQIKAATAAVAAADAIVIATPVYKAAYSGLLKAFLDLLPQKALAGKVVLPIATGGTIAHLLSIDYALRPVLQALCADRVLQGRFVLDTHVTKDGPDRGITDGESRDALQAAVTAFIGAAVPNTPRELIHA